jgi:hypothetical protein
MFTREYQNQLITNLRNIFGNELVQTEWDSVQYDIHIDNHQRVYAPRHDIAVGPFNSYRDLDIGVDRTKQMQFHSFTKRLCEGFLQHGENLTNLWNSISRCYLAIEIEFSGSSKHMLGSIVNASVSGSIGIVIVKKASINKAIRICNYLKRLEGLGKLKMNMLRNLFIFEDDDFLKLLLDFSSSSQVANQSR